MAIVQKKFEDFVIDVLENNPDDFEGQITKEEIESIKSGKEIPSRVHTVIHEYIQKEGEVDIKMNEEGDDYFPNNPEWRNEIYYVNLWYVSGWYFWEAYDGAMSDFFTTREAAMKSNGL